MELIQMKDWSLSVAPQALTLAPFKELFDRDKSKEKKRAVAEISFIYFYCDFKSDFRQILDEDIRKFEILKSIDGLPDKWEIDELVQNAINFYRDRQKTVSMTLLEDAESAAKKVSDFYKDVDLEERDLKSGKLIHDPKKVLDSIKVVPDTIKALRKVREEVMKDIQPSSSARGSIEKNIFEDDL
jgi:hypothetical protein